MYNYIGLYFHKDIINSTSCKSFNYQFRPRIRAIILRASHFGRYRR